MAERSHINLIFIGHVDHGKSTLVGRFMYDTGALPENEYRKIKEEAEAKGKGSFAFAYVMDSLKEERERGVTIDLSYKKFKGQKHDFTIIDAPGHRDFVKNMITGTSQADSAVLVVSAKDGPQPQTKEHAFLANVMGIKSLTVAINKMDEIGYKEEEFNKRKEEMHKLVKMVGFKDEQVDYVPVSAWIGDNVAKASTNMPWYKGKTLLQRLDELTAPTLPTDKPLRLPIQDVYSIKGVGTVPVGRVETGIAKPGDKIIVMPSKAQGEIKSLEAHHEQLTQAIPGDNVGFNVRGLERKDINRGDVVGHPQNAPTVAKEFIAQIVVLNHPTAIPQGYTPVFHMHTAQMSCTFAELQKRIDPKTGQAAEENPKFLKTGDAAIVKIVPQRPLVVEEFKKFPSLGRFAVRDMGATVAAGVVMQVTPRE
ncbi:MAG: translation elongation factor EF-1 subunit alpha [Candidatus Diapherotrites archaeon]|nr:translation elongation factor EF-1 subunit alpha [Candidatus Diapherotrites archaeon]MDZ4256529.1 translation elongation factor EF-1 subunit alpha [archaeon]